MAERVNTMVTELWFMNLCDTVWMQLQFSAIGVTKEHGTEIFAIATLTWIERKRKMNTMHTHELVPDSDSDWLLN